MKKLVSVLILLVLVASFASCSSVKTSNPIDFGKKYRLNEYLYYVFEADQTGYCECCSLPGYDYTQSGRVEFVWREASDGAVYLFETKTTYNKDHTEGMYLPWIDEPIYFSEDFFVYTYSNASGSDTRRYIKEGSELERLMED